MKLRLACADFTFPVLPHDQVLQLIAMLGIDGVDIGLFEDRSHLQPSGQLRQPRRSARRLRAQLDRHGLAAANVFLQLALDYASCAVNHPDAARRTNARDAFLRALDYVDVVGGGHLTALPGVHHDDEPRRDSLARAGDELAWRVERAQAAGITFAVEPHVGSFADTPKRAARLVRKVPGLTLTLDYGHLYPRGYSVAEIETLIPHTSHVHARGVNRHSGGATMTDNTIDWKRIVDRLSRAGYRGWIELEYGANNLTDTVALRDHLRAAAG